MLKDYMQQMVKMSPLQSYSLEIVKDSDELRVIGAAVSAEQAALAEAERLALAGGAVVGAAAGEDDALDRRGADAAWFAGAGVDVVVELEEAGNSVCVDVIGDRGSPKLDGFRENLDQSGAKTGEFGAGKTAGVAGGADAGVKESLVGVDVADAVEKRLVQ